ncbi:MAG: regulatory protein GemA [Rhodospirillales bacterium]|nr:regulatory protein GemA [Rhodospirillales bacterium]
MTARQAMLAKVHIAAKRLALEEESYRALLKRVTGKESAGACDEGELERLIGEFRRLGFTDAPRRRSEKPYVRMIHGLWGDLKPHLRNPTAEGLRAFVRRQTGVAAPEFLGPEQANKVIEGLKAWLERVWRDA